MPVCPQMELLPPFFARLLAKKQIRNLKTSELSTVFPTSFDLSQHVCYCIGRISRHSPEKDVKILIMHGCEKCPLIGTHLIAYMDDRGRMVEQFIHSLNTLRTRSWFDDKLSFERTTFIIYQDRVVRLHQIRHLIRLPLLDPEKGGMLSPCNMYVFHPSVRFVKNQLCVTLVVDHVMRLLYKLNDTPMLKDDVSNQIRNNLGLDLAHVYDEHQLIGEEANVFDFFMNLNPS